MILTPVFRFDEAGLVAELSRLVPSRRTLFCAMIATRMMPVYAMYLSRPGKPGMKEFMSALDYVWSFVEIGANAGEGVDGADHHLDAVMALLSGEGDAGPLYGAQAEDALTILAYALRGLKVENPQESAWAARRAYESADNLVMSRPGVTIGGASEEGIIRHPVVQAELSRQHEDLVSAAVLSIDQATLAATRAGCMAWGRAFVADLL
jgi:hypothetical protein